MRWAFGHAVLCTVGLAWDQPKELVKLGIQACLLVACLLLKAHSLGKQATLMDMRGEAGGDQVVQEEQVGNQSTHFPP